MQQKAVFPIIASRSIEATKNLIADLQNQGKDGYAILGDLQEIAQCKKVVQETIKKYHRIDGVVNNAGVNDGAGLENGPGGFSVLHPIESISLL